MESLCLFILNLISFEFRAFIAIQRGFTVALKHNNKTAEVVTYKKDLINQI